MVQSVVDCDRKVPGSSPCSAPFLGQNPAPKITLIEAHSGMRALPLMLIVLRV